MLLLLLLAVLHHQPSKHKDQVHFHCHLQDQASTIWDLCTSNAGKCNLFYGISLLYKTVQCFAADTDLDSLHQTADNVQLMRASL